MCLRTICVYEFCGQRPYSFIVRACGDNPDGLCESVLTDPFFVRDFCPECFMAFVDPRKTPSFAQYSNIDIFNKEHEFELEHYSEQNSEDDINAILDRAEAYVNKNFKEEDWDNLDIFCSPQEDGRLDQSSHRHLERLVTHRLIPYFWYSVNQGKGKLVTNRRRMLILQLRQAYYQHIAFGDIEQEAKQRGNEGKWRRTIGASGEWLGSEMTADHKDANEMCAICRSEESMLCDERSITLICGHPFHVACLSLAYETKDCPYCRRHVRGPQPDTAAPENGDLPRWLEEIAPFDGPKSFEKLFKTAPSLEAFNKLKIIYEAACKRSRELFAVVENVHQSLQEVRQAIDKWEDAIDEFIRGEGGERNLEGVSKDWRPRWIVLEGQYTHILFDMTTYINKHRSAMREAENFRNGPTDHRYYVYTEWSAAKMVHEQNRKRWDIERELENHYRECEPIVKAHDIDTFSKLGEEERGILEQYHRAVADWRLAIIVRDRSYNAYTLAEVKRRDLTDEELKKLDREVKHS